MGCRVGTCPSATHRRAGTRAADPARGDGLRDLLGRRVLVGAVALVAAYRYYRGEDPAERVAAREREDAVLQEVADS